MTDIIFCHFGLFLPFYPPNNPKNQNFEKLKKMPAIIIILHMCTIITMKWCMVPEILSAIGRFLCHFEPFFPLLPTNNPKYQNFEKIRNKPGGIVILHMGTINYNHMMYGS